MTERELVSIIRRLLEPHDQVINEGHRHHSLTCERCKAEREAERVLREN